MGTVRNQTHTMNYLTAVMVLVATVTARPDGPGGHHHHGDHGAHHGAHHTDHHGAGHHATHGAHHEPITTVNWLWLDAERAVDRLNTVDRVDRVLDVVGGAKVHCGYRLMMCSMCGMMSRSMMICMVCSVMCSMVSSMISVVMMSPRTVGPRCHCGQEDHHCCQIVHGVCLISNSHV